jgi:hypothetical protein
MAETRFFLRFGKEIYCSGDFPPKNIVFFETIPYICPIKTENAYEVILPQGA